MNVKELLESEKGNRDQIILRREGCFWRACEVSAMRFTRDIRKIKLTARHVKYLGEWMVYCGFPDTRMARVEEICSENNFQITGDAKTVIIRGMDCSGEEFERWKRAACEESADDRAKETDSKNKNPDRHGKDEKLAPIVEKHYDLVLWTLPKLAKFPKEQRFLLADRIERLLLDILEMLIEAVYSPGNRRDVLIRVNLRIDHLRYMVRIAKDMKYINLRAYDFFCRSVLEIGRMNGGWLKAQG